MRNQPDHLADDEVIAIVGCPLCKAKATLWCVYVKTGETQKVAPNTTSPAQRALLERVGTPTKRPHNERRAAARRKQEREQSQAQLEVAKADIPMATRERIAAWRAERDFDRREQDQLIMWLRCYGSILAGATS